MSWPLHEYDPDHDRRRLRRALLVLREHVAREVLAVLVPVVRGIARGLDRLGTVARKHRGG
jgi:hypothetical protein